MKTIRLFFFTILLSSTNMLSAQTGRIWTEKYNDEEYVIKASKYSYEITNGTYNLVMSNTTADYMFDGESILDYRKRRTELIEAISKIANEVFHLNQIYTSRIYHVSVACTFDSLTKDYARGICLTFNKEIKEYITLQKVYLLEKKLLESGLNAGRTNVADSSKKYFTMEGSDSTNKKE